MTASRDALTIELLAEMPDGNRKGWVHLLPKGTFTGLDGRGPYIADDLGAIIAQSRRSAGKRQMVIDYDHATDRGRDRPGNPAPAAGWIIGMQAREDGVWGLVEWTQRAAEHLAQREYRYLSPVITHSRQTGQVGAILRASLTNVPNLDQLTALASREENDMEQATRAEMSALLGLAPEADDAALIGAIRALAETKAEHDASRPDPTKWVPIGDFQRAVAETNKLRQGISRHAAEERVGEHIRKGIILPFMRDWAIDLCCINMPAYDKFIEGVGPGFSHLLVEAKFDREGQQSGTDLSEDERRICENLRITPEAYLKQKGN